MESIVTKDRFQNGGESIGKFNENGDIMLYEHMGRISEIPEGLLAAREAYENDEDGEVKDHRIIRRAKRTQSCSAVELDEFVNGGALANGLSSALRLQNSGPANRKTKQLKHSRGRVGEPKKGGAGGKGVWGKPGSELDVSVVCQDINDPNYDSDSQGEYKLESVEPELTDEQLEKVVKPILCEYLDHAKSAEVEALLSPLNIGSNMYKIPKMAVLLGLERHNAQREMISRLISDLYGCVLSVEHIAKGFDELLNALDDLVLDTPDAPNLIGQFIARCVADDCLPPKFITSYKGNVESKYVIASLEKAEVLISMNHGMAHLDNIWGMGGGNRPVKNLTNKMIDLLKEYKHSGDTEEAMRCLKELEVPHFHHELVYQACVLAIEDSTERACDQVVKLLKALTAAAVVTVDQFEKGAKRLLHDIQDISLDVPAAHALLELIGKKLHSAGILNTQLFVSMPVKGRKRFVSEGDGGLLKPVAL